MTAVALRDFEGSYTPSATGASPGLTACSIECEVNRNYDSSKRLLSAVLAGYSASSENPAAVVSGTAGAIESVTNWRASSTIINARQSILGETIAGQFKNPADETLMIGTFAVGQYYLPYTICAAPFANNLLGVVESKFDQLLDILDTNNEEKLFNPPQLPAQADRIGELLDQYAELKDGWLDDRSEAPGPAAVERARRLYESARANGYPPVRCYVSADGEVGLIWEKDKGYGNVGFWADNSLVYYVRSPDGKEIRDDIDDISINGENLPAELIKALRTFYVGS